MFALTFLGPGAALSQEGPPSEFTDRPPAEKVVDLKAQAWDAEQTAAEAEKAAEAARQKSLEAQQQAEAARERAAEASRQQAILDERQADEAAAASAVAAAAAQGVSQEELKALREEVRKARAAADHSETLAHEARKELAAHIEAQKKRYARPGFFLAAGVSWAPEIFDTLLTVSHGRSAYGAAGYRVNERFEVEMRYDGVRGFDISGDGIEGEAKAWSATLNARFFILTGKIQPFIAFGIGAAQVEADLRDIATDELARFKDTSMVIRPSAGLDFYISETLALTGDVAVHFPGGNISDLAWATLGGGIKLRF